MFETKNVCSRFYFVLAQFYFAFSPSVYYKRDFDRIFLFIQLTPPPFVAVVYVYYAHVRSLNPVLAHFTSKQFVSTNSYPSRPKLVNHVQRKSKGFLCQQLHEKLRQIFSS